MKATYCKVKKILTVRMSLDQYYDICDDTENCNPNRIYDLMDVSDKAIDSSSDIRTQMLVSTNLTPTGTTRG